jgi:hypothetical protein
MTIPKVIEMHAKCMKFGVISFLLVMISTIAIVPRVSASSSPPIVVSNSSGLSQKINVLVNTTNSGNQVINATSAQFELRNYVGGSNVSSPTDLTELGGGVYNATLDLSPYTPGVYYIHADIVNATGASYHGDEVNTIAYYQPSWTAGPSAYWDNVTDTVDVLSVPFVNATNIASASYDINVPTYNVTGAWFDVIPVGGGAPVAQGNLTFSGSAWVGTSSSMAWKWGNYTTQVYIVTANGTIITSPLGDTFVRSNLTEVYIVYIAGISGAVVIAIVILLVIRKRSGIKAKEKAVKKEIKVLKVDKSDIKKAKKAPPKPPAEKKAPEKKGVTKKSDELIFEVPKWEDEDSNNE